MDSDKLEIYERYYLTRVDTGWNDVGRVEDPFFGAADEAVPRRGGIRVLWKDISKETLGYSQAKVARLNLLFCFTLFGFLANHTL